jgi:predicted amino acid racemase
MSPAVKLNVIERNQKQLMRTADEVGVNVYLLLKVRWNRQTGVTKPAVLWY